MTSHDFSLVGLPCDIRLEIFSHMILPPFDGYGDYAGLWLSCRAFYEEADREGGRQLSMYLRSINKTDSVQHSSCVTSEDSLDYDETWPVAELVAPASVFGLPVINIRVPFMLPLDKHDWYLQKPPKRMCGTGQQTLLRTPGPRRDRYLAECQKREECDSQERIYTAHVEKVLDPLNYLHSLHAKIEIHLIADEGLMRTIGKTKMYTWSLKHGMELDSTVIGKILDVYVRQLGKQGFNRMQRWSDDWAFHAETIDLKWNFALAKKEEIEYCEHEWCVRNFWESRAYPKAQARYSTDRREGSVQIHFDVRGYVEKETRDAKTRLATLLAGDMLDWDEAEHCMLKEEVAQNRLKLQKLGIMRCDTRSQSPAVEGANCNGQQR